MTDIDDLFDYREVLFMLVGDFDKVKHKITWKPEIKDWIDYNLKFPVEIDASVTDDGVIIITPLFYNKKDATLFKLFWL